MTVPAAPVITSVTTSPTTLTVGTEITAMVTWTGFPREGIAYQWRNDMTPIEGATTPTYTPTELLSALNCLVTIDNGRGTATGASPFVTIPDPDDELGDTWPDDATVWPDDSTIWPD